MKRRSKIVVSVAGFAMAAVLVIALAGCGSTTSKQLSGNLSLSGSTTVLPLAQEAADMFMTDNPKVTVTVPP